MNLRILAVAYCGPITGPNSVMVEVDAEDGQDPEEVWDTAELAFGEISGEIPEEGLWLWDGVVVEADIEVNGRHGTVKNPIGEWRRLTPEEAGAWATHGIFFNSPAGATANQYTAATVEASLASTAAEMDALLADVASLLTSPPPADLLHMAHSHAARTASTPQQVLRRVYEDLSEGKKPDAVFATLRRQP